ncbi:hypothetical protein C9417_11190 [Rhizobium sp. SEMIA 4088]|nr:hypothetical protein C9417_11190 [Rhizobium sp. SEMIA 4088]
MSRKSAQRFCDNDMRKIKDLKYRKRILEIAPCFRSNQRNRHASRIPQRALLYPHHRRRSRSVSAQSHHHRSRLAWRR